MTVKEAAEAADQGVGLKSATAEGSAQNDESLDKDEEITKLKEDNKKLNYRILHLTRALDEMDAKFNK